MIQLGISRNNMRNEDLDLRIISSKRFKPAFWLRNLGFWPRFQLSNSSLYIEQSDRATWLNNLSKLQFGCFLVVAQLYFLLYHVLWFQFETGFSWAGVGVDDMHSYRPIYRYAHMHIRSSYTCRKVIPMVIPSCHLVLITFLLITR